MHVIVVGGGIVGLASATYLARRGVEVSVVEKSHLGAGATGKGGGIRTQFSSETNVRMTLESERVWDGFESEFGVAIDRGDLGYLFVARTEETAARLRENVELQNDLGVPNESLSPAEAGRRCPGLRTDGLVGASFSPGDRFVDANLALQGFAEACREAGVEFHVGTEVQDVTVDDGRVAGVETTDGELAGEFVVNAAGAWAGEVAAMAGLTLPVRPVLRRQLLVEPGTPFDDLPPLTMDMDTGFVFYPEDADSAIVSGQVGELFEVDPDAYDDRIDLDWTTAVLEGVSELSTHFGPETATKERIAGVYANTPDHNPVIEETVPGLVNAVGFSGHGFMHAPATGKLVTEIVVDGEPSLLDISAFESSRFDGVVDDEQNFI